MAVIGVSLLVAMCFFTMCLCVWQKKGSTSVGVCGECLCIAAAIAASQISHMSSRPASVCV
jgi:hypothetical protein